jgi:tetratricopeptide (TPR) repeat protein
VMTALKSKDGAKAALETALVWHKEEPGDVLGLVALGEAYEAGGALVDAARAYGSLIDLFSSRADLRRFAGERLEHIKEGEGLDLAIDTFQKAVAQRPDHPASHRLLAYARLRKGDLAGAFDAALNGAMRKYPDGRFAGVEQILREDLGLIGAAWIKKEPAKRADVMKHLQEAKATLETGPSIRFVLNWETDANDVDFHIMDAKGGHAYYAHKALPSGGSLYEDVTTGYGPECFTIRKAKGQRSGPYKLQAHYYARGPMGYGMGKLEIIDHDGSGGLTFEERPYVVMVDHAFLDLGVVK